MDKYHGINKANVSSTPIDYEVRGQKKSPSQPQVGAKTDWRFVFTLSRYLACILLAGLCMLGKFTSFSPAQRASSFIKDELSKDTVQEIIDKID